mgnify:CR=1 FL=1
MGYTLRYGKTYDQWVEEKARRIHDVLKYFYFRGEPVRLKEMMYHVYRERLSQTRMYWWRPIDGHFTDFKPSPFMKNFMNYLISELKGMGCILTGYVVEISESLSATDDVGTDKKTMVYRGTMWKRITISDSMRATDERMGEIVGRNLESVKKVIELRDAVSVCDTRPTTSRTRTYYANRVVRLPSLDTLRDLCRWKDPEV